MGRRGRARRPLPGGGAGGERSFDDAIDVVAGGEADGLVTLGVMVRDTVDRLRPEAQAWLACQAEVAPVDGLKGST